MSGFAPPVNIIVEPFGVDAALLSPTDPGGVTLPIPIPDQTGTTPGAASFSTGFPAATMSDTESAGGVPPFGQDANGILYMLSAYCAMLQAGQRCFFNAIAATAFGGYVVGAKVASATTLGRNWVNLVDGNANDPDVTPTGWAAEDPLFNASAPAAGTINNLVLPGASDFALDIDTTAGNVDITGFVAQRNGQVLYISNTGANLLQFLVNNVGSAAANRLRGPTDLAVVQNQTQTIKWFSGINRWLAI